jgi:hypothetical protein
MSVIPFGGNDLLHVHFMVFRMSTRLQLRQSRTQVVEGIVAAHHWVIPGSLTLPNTEHALLGFSVDLTNIVAGLKTVSWDGTITAQPTLPTSTLAIHAQTFGIAVVGAARQCALWPNFGFIGAHDLTAVWTTEANIAGASPIKTKPIACAIVWTFLQGFINRSLLTQGTCEAKVAITLTWGMDRDKGATAMAMTLFSINHSTTVWISAIGTHETGNAFTFAFCVAFSVGATIDLTDFRRTVILL